MARLKLLAACGGVIGAFVASWVALKQGGGPEVALGFAGLSISLSLLALAWSLVGILGAVTRWHNAFTPGLLIVLAGAAGYASLREHFFVPGALLCGAGVLLCALQGLRWTGRRTGASPRVKA